MCKNSSMMDLHFLSISSPDKTGFSWTGNVEVSGLAVEGREKEEKIRPEAEELPPSSLA